MPEKNTASDQTIRVVAPLPMLPTDGGIWGESLLGTRQRAVEITAGDLIKPTASVEPSTNIPGSPSVDVPQIQEKTVEPSTNIPAPPSADVPQSREKTAGKGLFTRLKVVARRLFRRTPQVTQVPIESELQVPAEVERQVPAEAERQMPAETERQAPTETEVAVSPSELMRAYTAEYNQARESYETLARDPAVSDKEFHAGFDAATASFEKLCDVVQQHGEQLSNSTHFAFLLERGKEEVDDAKALMQTWRKHTVDPATERTNEQKPDNLTNARPVAPENTPSQPLKVGPRKLIKPRPPGAAQSQKNTPADPPRARPAKLQKRAPPTTEPVRDKSASSEVTQQTSASYGPPPYLAEQMPIMPTPTPQRRPGTPPRSSATFPSRSSPRRSR